MSGAIGPLRSGCEGRGVLALQSQLRALVDAGLCVDGGFGRATDSAVRAYQRSCALLEDGIVGDITHSALIADSEIQSVAGLEDFRGRLGFLVGEEGHVGRPYWPGEHDPDVGRHSGVTLDPEFDLEHQAEERLRELYGVLLTDAQLAALGLCCGVRGPQAGELIERVSGIRIARADAARVLPQVAVSYWRGCVRSMPALIDTTCPSGAHTALLSLAYNAGVDDVERLAGWGGIALALASIPEIPERRAREAALIISSI